MRYGPRSKYGVRTDAQGIEERTADNIVFHSKREAIRYRELKASLNAGIIRDLELQPRFPMVVNGMKICEYRADFRYVECKTGETVIEDSKGARTANFIIKAKLFHALYVPLRIREV